jgi:hypothetical protein
MKSIRQREAEDIMKEIQSRALSYTPEWHCDLQKPDIGVALAQVYAGMHSSIEKKYAILPDKLKTDYFNCLNVSMKSSAPASGYAVFGLSSDEMDGSFLQAGTALRSDVADEQGQAVPVELSEDVFVAPDTLQAVYEVDPREDYIGCIYDAEAMEERPEYKLFSMEPENIQSHRFYLSHPYIFKIGRYASIGLYMKDSHGERLSDDVLSIFADPGRVRFFYETGEAENGEVSLSDVSIRDGVIYINKPSSDAVWTESEHGGITAMWLGCEVRDAAGLEGLGCSQIYLTARCAAQEPDNIYATGTDQPGGELCFPFGERFAQQDEVYFASEDAFSKHGARIRLSFTQEYAQIPITEGAEPQIDWKFVMPKESVPKDVKYNITIEEVVWEYFNGNGWARLFPGRENSDVFSYSAGKGRHTVKMAFTCPDDLQPVLAGSDETYYIRARILKVNNAYKTTGNYVSPFIEGVSISYEYEGDGLTPGYLYCENNMEQELVKMDTRRQRVLRPVKVREGTAPEMYLALGRFSPEGPVRVLFDVEHVIPAGQPALKWEYYKGTEWADIHVIDETEDLRRTGIVTLPGIQDAGRCSLFGREESCWLRIRQVPCKNPPEHRPRIRGMYVNAAKVVTLLHGLSEYLTMEGWIENAQFALTEHNISSLELWVREDGQLSENDLRSCRQEGRYREVLDENGAVSEQWVRWEETDSIRRHMPGERVYVPDLNNGTITFGGGAHGRVPAPGIPDGIYVSYSVGGGALCNVSAGMVNGLELSEGFVSTVFNPLALTGGYDRETAAQALERAAGEQSHHFRAVTCDDYENLALEASGNISKIRACSCLNELGEEAAGYVTLVLLTKDYDPSGYGYEEQKKEIYKYFKDKLPAGLVPGERFVIRPPRIAQLEIHVDATIADDQDAFRLQQAVLRELEDFLDPVTGNFSGEGWDIGNMPQTSQLATVIRSVPGIGNIGRIIIFARLINEPGEPSAAYEALQEDPFVLVRSGRHVVNLTKKTQRR